MTLMLYLLNLLLTPKIISYVKKTFDLDLKHNPKRNGYDLGKDVIFSAKPSELLPIWHRSVLPTDNFKIRVRHKSRTKPVNTAAYTNIKEYFDFFFVPYSFLWKNAKQVHTENTKNSIAAVNQYGNLAVGKDTPHFNISDVYNLNSIRDNSYPASIFTCLNDRYDYFGFRRSAQMTKLLNYLGYPYVSEADLDIFMSPNTGDEFPNGVFGPWVQTKQSLYPLLAYNAIYYTFYRNKVWETNQPYNYNVDYLSTNTLVTFDTSVVQSRYWDNSTMFDMKYSNYPKDLFFGILPDSQEGDVSVAPVDVDVETADIAVNRFRDGYGDLSRGVLTSVPLSDEDGFGLKSTNTNDEIEGSTLVTDLRNLIRQAKGNLNILELRKATFLQRYREIIGSGDIDYQKIIYKIFGVEISNEQEHLPVYLGGDTNDIPISEVVNQNLSGDSQASIRGKGEVDANTSEITFSNPNKEYGIIMCIYHCQPRVQYALSNMHFDNAKIEADDYANPIFDQLGFEEIPLQFFTTRRDSSVNGLSGMLGYTTRYFDYKTDVGTVMGSLRADVDNDNASGWLAPVTEKLLELPNRYEQGITNITYNFFKVSPRILDPIFSVKADNRVTSDPIDVFAYFDVQAVRPLDYHGFPY